MAGLPTLEELITKKRESERSYETLNANVTTRVQNAVALGALSTQIQDFTDQIQAARPKKADVAGDLWRANERGEVIQKETTERSQIHPGRGERWGEFIQKEARERIRIARDEANTTTARRYNERGDVYQLAPTSNRLYFGTSPRDTIIASATGAGLGGALAGIAGAAVGVTCFAVVAAGLVGGCGYTWYVWYQRCKELRADLGITPAMSHTEAAEQVRKALRLHDPNLARNTQENTTKKYLKPQDDAHELSPLMKLEDENQNSRNKLYKSIKEIASVEWSDGM